MATEAARGTHEVCLRAIECLKLIRLHVRGIALHRRSCLELCRQGKVEATYLASQVALEHSKGYREAYLMIAGEILESPKTLEGEGAYRRIVDETRFGGGPGRAVDFPRQVEELAGQVSRCRAFRKQVNVHEILREFLDSIEN